MKSLTILVILMSLVTTSCGSRKKDSKQEPSLASTVNPVAPDSASIESRMIPQEDVSAKTSQWSPRSKNLLNQFIAKYGQPQEANEFRVTWYKNGQWDKTVLNAESEPAIIHQTVNMEVPPENMGELGMFSKNITVDQAQEEVTVANEREELNFLSVNLAKEVVDGRLSSIEARRQFTSIANNLNRSSYLERLNFRMPADDMKQSQEE